MNQVKSTHHFGSVKYAQLVDPMEEMEIANSPVPTAAVLQQKFIIFLTTTQLAEVTTVTITVRHFCGTDLFVTMKFHYSEGSKGLLMI